MNFTSRLALALCGWLLAHGQGVIGQAPPVGRTTSGEAGALSFGVPITAAVRSGEGHEYELIAAAGDLVSGTIARSGLAALVHVADSTGHVVRTSHVFSDCDWTQRRSGRV